VKHLASLEQQSTPKTRYPFLYECMHTPFFSRMSGTYLEQAKSRERIVELDACRCG
jgi:hypothetical protein